MHKKKYAVYPGYVTSQNDGDQHYIDAHQLMRLYQVSPQECIIFGGKPEEHPGMPRGYAKEFVDRLIPLRPKFNGNYRKPTPAPTPTELFKENEDEIVWSSSDPR